MKPAFYDVSNSNLLCKLYYCGITGNVLNCFIFYLSNIYRCQQINK